MYIKNKFGNAFKVKSLKEIKNTKTYVKQKFHIKSYRKGTIKILKTMRIKLQPKIETKISCYATLGSADNTNYQ